MAESLSTLKYRIYKWSSYSANYLPKNILQDLPNDQASRWSSESNYLPQFIMLKLPAPAIFQFITFGKYDKEHVCNLKKFQVYAGLEESNMVEVLHGGLKNDSTPETFSVKCKMDKDKLFPCQYIKIAPIMSWGPSYNFSIWYVKLQGISSPEFVQSRVQWYYQYREREAIRMCLKHFREQDCMGVYRLLQRAAGVKLESPLVSELHQRLVEEGNFVASEQLIQQAAQENMFRNYISDQDYQAEWRQFGLELDGDEKPGMRGGHQMCIDTKKGSIYVFGGWSGVSDLSDFWRYDIADCRWTCLSDDCSTKGGPTPRSCHKMCIDCENGLIYILGRYLDSGKRNREALENELYVYAIETDEWTLLCSDVSKYGGPKLIFDHQMCFDDEKRVIYVFGGRVLLPNPPAPTNNNNSMPDPVYNNNNNSADVRSNNEFSGLYSYDVATRVWRLLREDSGNAGPEDIRSRIGHSMLFDSKDRRLYIFGGQRLKEDVNDFLYYAIDTDQVVVLSDGASKDSSIPPPGFTQRATIDCQLGEIYMLSGLSKDRSKREDNMHNSFWVYNIQANRWRCVYKNHSVGALTSTAPDTSILDRYFHPDSPPYEYWKRRMTMMASASLRHQFSHSTAASGSCSKKLRYGVGVRGARSKTSPGASVNMQPCPRYAHQLVYDNINKIHYMFGGNPGRGQEPEIRLDDFWCLRLTRADCTDVLKKCKYLIRRQRYNEMADRVVRSNSSQPCKMPPSDNNDTEAADPIAALRYLTGQVYETVEHRSSRDERKYRHLASRLFGVDSSPSAPVSPASSARERSPSPSSSSSSSSSSSCESDDSDDEMEDFVQRTMLVKGADADSVRANRTAVFNKLMKFFDDEASQPEENITDLLPMSAS